MNAPIPLPLTGPSTPSVFFNRQELMVILALYGKMVALGEWRDYAITGLRDHAEFAIYRATAENPLYRVEKHPKLRTKQGLYVLVDENRQILRRGHELVPLLKELERKQIKRIK